MKGTPPVKPRQYTYRTDGPAALAAYRTAVAARAVFTAQLHVDAAAIGGNNGARCGVRGFGGPEYIPGLEPDGSGTIPAGWRIVRDRLEPALRGPGSAAARRWLKEHQPTPGLDRRYVLKGHGLAYQSRVSVGGDGYKSYLPDLFEHDGQLWACYRGEPDGDFPGEPARLTWPACTLAEFHTAQAAAEQDLAARAA